LSKFIIKRIGEKWITDFTEIKKLAEFASDPETQQEFIEIKRKNKIRLIEFINHENKLRDSSGKISISPPIIDANSIFDVQVKRLHEYKRQLMNILHVIMVYHDMLTDPENKRAKRTVIFGGKSAASYDTAKDIIRFISAVARKINRDPDVDGNLKVVYIENYNVSKAEVIIPAADLSEQISTAGMEASGTGNMKFAINGALTIGTNDGANIEMREQITDQWWPFSFGCSSEEIAKMTAEGSYNPSEIYNSNSKIKRAVDTLRDRTFAKTEEEHQAFSDLYHKLMEMHYGCSPDRYYVLKDLQSYYETQLKVEELYQDPLKWAEYAIHNIAGMGMFSSDETTQRYCKEIWGITPCEVQDDVFERVKHEYSLMDICKAYPTK
jgi:starch phosphorylase